MKQQLETSTSVAIDWITRVLVPEADGTIQPVGSFYTQSLLDKLEIGKMQVKPILLAAALITLPAATAFAQSSPSQSSPTQSAPMQSAPSTSGTTPDASAPQSPTAGAPTTGAPTTGATADAAAPATAADFKAGAKVYDATGGTVGTIQSVASTGAVVSTGTARAQIPFASFTKNSQGLIISMTKVQLEAAVAKATPAKP